MHEKMSNIREHSENSLKVFIGTQNVKKPRILPPSQYFITA